jgi:spectinomycin phosphotransferase
MAVPKAIASRFAAGLTLAVVRIRPAGVADDHVRQVLAAGWRIQTSEIRHEPVGGGSYQWVVQDNHGGRWFVTVDDLDNKAWLGDTRAAVAGGLRSAMETAHTLRHEAGLRFVVAPIPTVQGELIATVGSRYAAAVFRFLDGSAGEFGDKLPARERRELVDMLAALHQTTPGATKAPRARIGLARRRDLDSALSELGEPWSGGPFAEPARRLLANSAERLRRALTAFDEMTEHVAAAPDPVLTHGEPHAANLIWLGGNGMLIDWDTVGLAPPERDLWMVAAGDTHEVRRYTKTAGRPVDPVALAFYRLRWGLDDLSYFLADLRADHDRTPQTEHVWRALQITVSATLP